MAAATVTGPIRERQTNDVFYVAAGAFPTIQSAVNFVRIFNGGAGQIVVGFHGPDPTPISTLIGGTEGTMFITDLRLGMAQNWVWNGTNFFPSPDIQLQGFIAKGNPEDYGGGFTIASTALNFDPAGDAGNGNGGVIVTANPGQPMPAVSLVGQPSDGSPAQTFLRGDKDPVSGFLHVRMPQALELNNADGNINLWTGQPFGTAGSKGMTIDADPTTNGIDFQGKTVGGANDQAIRLNPAGGDIATGPGTFAAGGNITAPSADITELTAQDAAFDTGMVAGSPIRTFENTPILSIIPPDAFIDNRDLGAGNNAPPFSVEAVTCGSLQAGGDLATAGRPGVLIYAGPDIYNPGISFFAIPRRFQANFQSADAARQVEFYLLTPNGTGGYTPFYATGLLPFAGTGLFTYEVPSSASIRCSPGTVIGVLSTSIASSGVLAATFSTNVTTGLQRNGTTRLTVGVTYTGGAGGFNLDPTHIPQFSCTFIREGVLVPTRAADLPYGYAKLDANSAIKAPQLVNTLPLVSDNYQTPPLITSALLGNPGPLGGSTGGSILITDYPTTFASVARSFAVTLAGAVNYELQLFSPNGDGTYKLIWSSGSQAGVTGVNTFVVPNPLAVRCPIGTIVGIVAGGNLSFSAVSGKTALRMGTSVIGAMAINKSFGLNYDVSGTLNAANPNRFASVTNIPMVIASFTHEAVMVATAWANKAGGYAALDDRSDVTVNVLPHYLGGTGVTSLANGATETTVVDPTLGATKTNITFPNVVNQYNVGPNLPMTSSSSGFNNRTMISYNETSPGFPKDGILTLLRIPPGGLTAAGAKMQAWVVRPIGVFNPGVTAATFSFTVIASIGEITADTAGNYKEFSNLTVPVRQGDLVMLRGVLCSPGFVTGGAPPVAPNSGNIIFTEVADKTLAGQVGQIITSISSHGLVVGHYAEVLSGGYAALGPSSLFGPDGHLLPSLYRQTDNPWNGKKVVAVGTSITAMNPNPGGGATNTGFINQTFRATQCNGINNGFGSSTMVFQAPGNPTRSSCSATIAELAAIGINFGSYEATIVAPAPDLLIIDHGVNDDGFSSGAMFAGDGSMNVDRGTFLGANNYVIQKAYAANPNMRIVMLTPPSVYIPGFVNPTPTTPTANLNAGIVQRVADIKALGAFWDFPVLDMSTRLGLTSVKTMPAVATTNFGTQDGLHPTQFTHDIMARVLIEFINGV